jgi:putative ABC transport system ATP-binding protein
VEVSALGRNALTRLRGQRIGFIFQSFNLLLRLSAWENTALPLCYRAGRLRHSQQNRWRSNR